MSSDLDNYFVYAFVGPPPGPGHQQGPSRTQGPAGLSQGPGLQQSPPRAQGRAPPGPTAEPRGGPQQSPGPEERAKRALANTVTL